MSADPNPVYVEIASQPPDMPLPMMAREVRRYESPPEEFAKALAHVTSWAVMNDYSTQFFGVEDGRSCIQIKSDSLFKRCIGMNVCLNVLFSQEDDSLLVECGEGRWLSKIGIGAIGLITAGILFPLAITAGIGLYWQAGLPDKVYAEVERFTHK